MEVHRRKLQFASKSSPIELFGNDDTPSLESHIAAAVCDPQKLLINV